MKPLSFQLFFERPNDVLPNPTGAPATPANAPTPAEIPPAKRGGIECAFCECQIAPDGGVLKTSDRARGLARAADTIADLKHENGQLRAEIARLTPADPAPAPAKKKSHPLDFRG